MKNQRVLKENLSFDRANIIVESESNPDTNEKSLYMKGIFLEGGLRNANGRVYPVSEIQLAVEALNSVIKNGNSVLGEVDHPDDLNINLDRVSHMITNMWMDGPNGLGKLKMIPTPMGLLIETMLKSGVKLGVSSRGSGEVNESSGHVSGFEIVTVDIVAQPSAPHAYPKAIYESLMNMRNGHRYIDNVKNAAIMANPTMATQKQIMTTPFQADQRLQKYIQETMLNVIKDLKLKK